MGNSIACVNETKEKSLRICKREWKFMKSNWDWVIRRTKLDDPYKGGLYVEDPNMASLCVPYGTCNQRSTAILPNEGQMNELNEATRKRVLKALKGNLWKEFRKGLLQRQSLKSLCIAADNATDIPNMYLKAEEIKEKFMKFNKYYQWMEEKLSYAISKLKIKKHTDIDLEIHQLKKSNFGPFRNCSLWIYFTTWLEPLVFAVIILNVIHISFDIYFIHSESRKYRAVMETLSAFFILFYTFEIIIKITALRWSLYMRVPWNVLNFIISVYAILEGILDVILLQFPSKHTYASHFRIILILRTLSYYHFLKIVFLKILSFIRKYTSSRMYYAYDIGQGFLFASEAVLKDIDLIVDYGPCAEIPKAICEENIRKMLDVLDEFERDYPSIVLALKSNRAARRILNRVKFVLHSLTSKSLVLPGDARELNSILFKMTKKVVYAPKAHHFIGNIQMILREVDWISPELADFIYENHIIATYDTGDVIQEAGSHHEFLFIIAKGIVKVICEDPEDESHFQMFNNLQNSDSLLFFGDIKNKHFHDYLKTPQTIGLLGFLQQMPSVTSAVCEKDCELIQIDYAVLNEAQEMFEDFTFCVWRSISIKIAVQLLKNQQRYKTYTNEDINLLLQKAILPNLTEATSLEVPFVVEDMVIIQGRMKDVNNKVEFLAPCYVPNTSRQLKLLDDVIERPPVIMLLLLNKKYSFHTFTNWIFPDEIEKRVLLN